MRLPPPLVALLLVAASLLGAGCIGAGDATDSDTDDDLDPTTNDTADNTTDNPDGRGRSSAFDETNRTTDGVGGQSHQHDYWRGRSAVTIYDDTVHFSLFPLYPDGQGEGAKNVAYVKLPVTEDGAPMLVFEGTERVEMLVGTPMLEEGTANPAAANIRMQYRSAAASEWSEPIDVTPEEPLNLDVAPEETDMPHSVQSLWVFRFTTDRPDVSSFPLTITVHRGHEILDWPGHPDFYAESDSRVVFDEHVQSQRSGISEWLITGAGSSWVTPERLISHGTTQLDVYVNVTRVEASTGAPATGYFLEYHDATILHDEDRYNERVHDQNKEDTSEMENWHFVIEVDHDGMDGPYQPESRWGFRLVATFGNVAFPTGGGIGFCPGCFPYELEYDLTIVARTGEDAVLLE